MKAIKIFGLIGITFFIGACKKDTKTVENNLAGLEKYLDDNKSFQRSSELIACAASQPKAAIDFNQYPVSVFFYPIAGAHEFRYFETSDINVDILDYSRFDEKTLPNEPVFNGYLWRFKNKTPSQDVWGIATYKVGNTIHICRAIRIKHYSKPTQFAPELVSVTDSLTFPKFNWNDGVIPENAIYFQVVSDTLTTLYQEPTPTINISNFTI